MKKVFTELTLATPFVFVRRPAPAGLALVAGAVLVVLGSAKADSYVLGPGKLDPTFGKGGLVATKIGPRSGARALAIQRDGKIVAAGSADLKGFALVRYRRDGSIDTTFGLKGRVRTRLESDRRLSSGPAWSLALQPDGKIIAAGAGFGYFTLARYMRNGKLDAGFGKRGIVRTSFSRGRDGGTDAKAIVLQPDGKIVAAGIGLFSQGERFAVARYNADGNLDSSFGSGGKVTTAINGGASDVVLQPDGKIVVAGSTRRNLRAEVLCAVVRYKKDGSLDSSFGSGGVAKTAVGSLGGASAVVLQRDGKIVAVGDVSSRFGLVRYNANGSLDPSFGSGGKAKAGFGSGSSASPTAAVLQRDGRIVVAGWVVKLSRHSKWDFALARFRPNGGLDRGFGAGGKVTTSFTSVAPPNSGPRMDTAWAVAIQPNGKIVVAGDGEIGAATKTKNNKRSKFEIARYIGV